MKIVLAGGRGLIGSHLVRHYGPDHDVVILSRSAVPGVDAGRGTPPSARIVSWDGKHVDQWADEIDGADVVINLAGRSVNCRMTPRHRREVLDSRVDSTTAIGQAIQAASMPPSVWLQASTANVYPHTFGEPNTETSPLDDGTGVPDTWRFSVSVGKAWEQAATDFVLPATRLVLMRISLVMAPDRGSVFDVLMGLVRKGLGGKNGDGRQYVSWIHYRDMVRVIDWLIDETHQLEGPVNIGSPHPVTNSELMAGLRRAAGVRVGLPAPRWLLEIGAIFMRTETELILKSRRVSPKKLLDSGFEFEYPEWLPAAQSLFGEYEESQS